MGHQPIVLEAERDFPIPPADLWELLANTDDLDREIGLPHVAYGPVIVSPDGLYREAAARFWGLLAARWREYPFEWVKGERYAVLRVFEAGFLDTFYGGVDLRTRAQGTSVRVFAELTPRTFVGWGVARLTGRKGIRDTLAYCQRFATHGGSESNVPLPSHRSMSRVDQARLDQLVVALRERSFSEPLLQRFARHLAASPDREVLRGRARRSPAPLRAGGTPRGAVSHLGDHVPELQGTQSGSTGDRGDAFTLPL